MLAYWGYNYGTTGTLISILIWVLITVLVVEIIRAIFSSTRHTHTPPPAAPLPPAQPVSPTTVIAPAATAKSPLEILNERYAKGEIHKDEFDQKKADILNHTG